MGLPEDRGPLFVSYFKLGDREFWQVIEGKKIGTPKSYKLHVGCESELEKAEIMRFEYTRQKTTIDFKLRDKDGTLVISNESDAGKYSFGGLDEVVDVVYNYFGDENAQGMMPSRCEEYFQD